MTLEKKVEIKSFMKSKGITIDDIRKELRINKNNICYALSLKKNVENPVFDKMIYDWYLQKKSLLR